MICKFKFKTIDYFDIINRGDQRRKRYKDRIKVDTQIACVKGFGFRLL